MIGFTIVIASSNSFTYRFDIEKYRKKGVVILTWTVNDLNEQRHLSEVLGVHYMTDQTSTHQ